MGLAPCANTGDPGSRQATTGAKIVPRQMQPRKNLQNLLALSSPSAASNSWNADTGATLHMLSSVAAVQLKVGSSQRAESDWSRVESLSAELSRGEIQVEPS